MNRRKIALALVLGVGGLSFAAHALFSFQVDAAGAKGLARALIAHAGSEMGISAEVQGKVTGLAELGIDQAAPVLAGIYQNLSALDAGASGKEAEARFDDMNRAFLSLVDVKDRVVAEAGKSLSPRERATTIVKVGARFHEAHPSRDSNDAVLGSLRAAHQASLSAYLKLDAARSAKVFGAMDTFAAQRKGLRDERRAAFELLETAVGANASDAALATLLAGWDKVNAKASDVTRAQIAEASRQFTLAEKLALVHRAKQHIDRALIIVALIGKFAPIRG